MKSQLLDRKTMATMLGVSVDTFRRKVEKRPDFPRPVLRLSRETVRWDEAEVLRWLKHQRVHAQQ